MDGSPQRIQCAALQPAREQPSSPLPAPWQPVSQQPDSLQPQTYEDAWRSIVASGGLDFRNYRAQGDRDGAASNTLRWKSAAKGDGAGSGSGCGCDRNSSATLLQFQPHVLQPLAPPSLCGVPSGDATWRPSSDSGQDSDSDSEASSGSESASEGASEGAGSSDLDGSTLVRCQPDSRGRSLRHPAANYYRRIYRCRLHEIQAASPLAVSRQADSFLTLDPEVTSLSGPHCWHGKL